jgi:methyltransferase (TIGR00027 family)
VFEVDHPDTARRKAEFAETAYVDVEVAPSVPVTIDFARESIELRLRTVGLAPDARTLWIWEGVTMYLPEQAVRDTLKMFAGLSGRNSLVVCDVLSDPRRAGLLARTQTRFLEAAMEWIYLEPFLWHCRQDQIASFFTSAGLTVLEDLGLDELVGRYERRQKGWLEAAPSLHLIVSEPHQHY